MEKRRRRNRKWISRLIILVLLIVAAVVCFLVWDNYFNDKKEQSVDVDTQKIEEKESEVVEVEQETDSSNIEEKKETVQYDGDNPNNSDELTGVITYAAASGDDLLIRVNIDQYLSEGSCELRLVLENDVNVYSDKVDIVSSAMTSTCEGFNIPLSVIGGGNYKIYINMMSGNMTGVINGEVSV